MCPCESSASVLSTMMREVLLVGALAWGCTLWKPLKIYTFYFYTLFLFLITGTLGDMVFDQLDVPLIVKGLYVLLCGLCTWEIFFKNPSNLVFKWSYKTLFFFFLFLWGGSFIYFLFHHIPDGWSLNILGVALPLSGFFAVEACIFLTLIYLLKRGEEWGRRTISHPIFSKILALSLFVTDGFVLYILSLVLSLLFSVFFL